MAGVPQGAALGLLPLTLPLVYIIEKHNASFHFCAHSVFSILNYQLNSLHLFTADINWMNLNFLSLCHGLDILYFALLFQSL